MELGQFHCFDTGTSGKQTLIVKTLLKIYKKIGSAWIFILPVSAAVLVSLLLILRIYLNNTAVELQYLTLQDCLTAGTTNTLSCEEISLLSERERLLTGYAGKPKTKSFVETPSKQFLNAKVSDPKNGGYQYLSAAGVEVTISKTLESPTFTTEIDDAGFASIMVSNGNKDDQLYIEIGNDPLFESSRIWRWPALKPNITEEDIPTTKNSDLYLFNLATGDINLYNRTIHLPFTTNMISIVPNADSPLLSMNAVVSAGRSALKMKITNGAIDARNADVELTRMIHRYIQHGFLISSDSYNKPPVETFLARNGECGNLNSLAQAMLELAGIRSRLVIGFNPTVRQIKPAGGHTLVEVLYADGWGIMDTYMDLFQPDVDVSNLHKHSIGTKSVLSIDNTKFSESTYGSEVTLSNLFRYRFYGDGAQRLPMQSMLQLGDSQANYGRSWPLRKMRKKRQSENSIAPANTTPVYIRARFIQSKCSASWNTSCADPKAIASAWTQHTL